MNINHIIILYNILSHYSIVSHIIKLFHNDITNYYYKLISTYLLKIYLFIPSQF